MQQIVYLAIGDIEIILWKQFLQLFHPYASSLERINVQKGIVRLYRSQLLPAHLDNPQPLKDLHNQWDEMALNLSCNQSLLLPLISQYLMTKGCKLIDKILPWNKALPGPVKSFEKLIEFALIDGELIL